MFRAPVEHMLVVWREEFKHPSLNPKGDEYRRSRNDPGAFVARSMATLMPQDRVRLSPNRRLQCCRTKDDADMCPKTRRAFDRGLHAVAGIFSRDYAGRVRAGRHPSAGKGRSHLSSDTTSTVA